MKFDLNKKGLALHSRTALWLSSALFIPSISFGAPTAARTPAAAKTTAQTTAPPGKKSAGKTLHAKDLRSSFHPAAAPGHSSIPVAGDSSPGPGGFTVKMRPKTALAHNLPAKAQSRAVAATSRPINLTEPISNFARTIRASYMSSLPQVSTGQGLAVGDSYLVSSASFVSDAWTNSGDVKFYSSESDQPLILVSYDLASNFAIFSTGLNSHSEHSVPFQRLRSTPTAPSEDLYTIGLNGSVVNTKSNFAAAPSETRFVFDKSGRWVGTALTPATRIFEVIHQLELRPPRAISMTVLRQQAMAWQERWTTSFFAAAKAGSALRTLECSAYPLYVENPETASQIVRTRLVRCANSLPISVTRDYEIGFDLVTGDLGFATDAASYLAKDKSVTTVLSNFTSQRAPASINELTTAECQKSDVLNSHQHQMHVRFCTSALKTVAGLSDTTMTVVRTDGGVKATAHSLHLRGFEPKNAKRFLQWMIETETL